MIRIVAGIALAIHGLIHLIGFVVPWQLAEVSGFPYRTDSLAGALELGPTGAKVVGVVWLVVAVGFVVAGVGLALGTSWALTLTGVLAVASSVVCLLGLPEAVAGLVINLAILGALAIARLAPRHHATA